MNNKNFTNLNENELYNTEGGCDPLTIAALAISAVGLIITAANYCDSKYQEKRTEAYNSGKQAAYSDLRK